jgi:hypothetical protein
LPVTPGRPAQSCRGAGVAEPERADPVDVGPARSPKDCQREMLS